MKRKKKTSKTFPTCWKNWTNIKTKLMIEQWFLVCYSGYPVLDNLNSRKFLQVRQLWIAVTGIFNPPCRSYNMTSEAKAASIPLDVARFLICSWTSGDIACYFCICQWLSDYLAPVFERDLCGWARNKLFGIFYLHK